MNAISSNLLDGGDGCGVVNRNVPRDQKSKVKLPNRELDRNRLIRLINQMIVVYNYYYWPFAGEDFINNIFIFQLAQSKRDCYINSVIQSSLTHLERHCPCLLLLSLYSVVCLQRFNGTVSGHKPT